ncbi:Glyoxylase, beta-lactamase superfamily II [Agromyces sp. CF514]|uniref:MBL fold metallo-hydrolase n=1 Tax=Agromyces sp. CF514 TaxID=1881031 RepID=UPI0008E8C042|nr:MBL fold metallo-hydrolase [Agromyces sp. CF514]SFR70745.1 Glyoxylase, beta-lactamase superfamily II [Agromyces sp. CF514]
MELRPGLHRIQAPLGDRFVALYLLVGDDAALLVDTGVRESITDTLLPYLDAAGIPRERIRWAVNTHCDYDHTGGNGALKAAIPSVQLVAHGLDADLVEDVQRLIDERYGEFRETDGFDDPPETTAYLRSVSDLVPIDLRVEGGEEFDLGGRTVRVLHVPGHSPGHVAVHDEANRALLIGDATLGESVLFADGSPAFPPTYRDTDPYVESLRAFRALDADLLLTAHYPVYEGEGVARFLVESEAYTERIDELMSELLAARTEPATTLELVREAGSALGPWGADALDYSVFPVTGNLERLERRGLVTSAVEADGRRTWRWAR